ncbi:MAG: calcineurin-like phosphoesterase C-terminal domain-containing protein [Candidatus Cryptobacteroides sp.]
MKLFHNSIFCTFLLFLISLPSPARGLRVAFVGDPQVDDTLELGFARRSIYRELMQRKDIDLAVFLGDLVNDDTSMLPATRRTLDLLPFRWFCVPGNHDRDLYPKNPDGTRRVRDLQTYRKVIGRPDTAFVKDGIRFILMNDVRRSERGEYEDGLTQGQKEWLDSVVTASSGNVALTVFAAHIPFSRSERADSVMAILEKAGRLMPVFGHTHTVSRHSLRMPSGRETEILLAGASCGSWWRGVPDGAGIPYALQNCGAPRGYFIASFKGGGDYSLKYKCVGRPESEMCSAYALPVSSSKDSTLLTVNVFGGSSDGILEAKAKGVKGWIQLSPDAVTAPEVLEVIDFNRKATKEERKKNKRDFIPLRNMKSPHVWSAVIPSAAESPVGRTLKVRYRDAHTSFTSSVVLKDGTSLLQKRGR